MRLKRDVVVHNLGFFVYDARGEASFHVIIPKGTPIPCEVVDKLITVVDNQDSLRIKLFEGLEQGQREDKLIFLEGYALGECVIELPPGLPSGTPIEVTYGYTADQNLEITAKIPDRSTSLTVAICREVLQ